jgi:hypothetical protein
MVAFLRNCHELISVLLDVWVPLALDDADRDHGLAKDVFVAVHEVPYSQS